VGKTMHEISYFAGDTILITPEKSNFSHWDDIKLIYKARKSSTSNDKISFEELIKI